MTFQIEAGVLTGCSGIEEVVRIPSEVPVLAGQAFRGNQTIREVYFPGNVYGMEAYALKHCTNLRKAVLPDSIKEIRDGTFAYCEHLEEVVLGRCVERIDYGAFYGCRRLKRIRIRGRDECAEGTVQLPPTLQRIGNGAFNGCAGLREVCLPNSVHHIGNYAFSDTGITELVLPESVAYTGTGILKGCKVRHLTILGDRIRMEPLCDEADLAPDAMLTADALDIPAYPFPFTTACAIRSFVARRAAGEDVPAVVEERFRKYLEMNYYTNLKDPLVLSLMLEWKSIPLDGIVKSVQRSLELQIPAVTAALLQYQHEMFSQEQIQAQWRKEKGETKGGDLTHGIQDY